MPREIGIWSYTLREWQDRCFHSVKNTFEEGRKKDFLADVTPAGGKTTFSVRTIFWFLQMRFVSRVVIVVHTEHLKKQWALSAARFGIDLDPNFQNNGRTRETSDFHGICVTYQQVGLNPTLHRYAVDNVPTLVIFDEIHHAGDEKSWGTGIQTAYENAAFRLCLTGTAFRSDNNPIPFVTYEDGISKPDFRYSYSQAIVDKVCRVIYFPAYDGIMEWKIEEKKYSHTFSDMLKEAESSQRLRTALDPGKSRWLEDVLRDADQKLEEIRKGEHPDAGGLILAVDQKHAKQIARLLIKVCNESAEIVISEDKYASNKIRKFADGNRKWIIAVKMISEGVDIPRLRVGVYATNVKKDLFFRQVVGRIIRFIKELNKQDAYLFIPQDPEIVNLAREIEIERDHALNQEEEFSDTDRLTPEEREMKKFEAISATVTEKTQFELSLNDRVASMFEVQADATVDITKKVIEKREQQPEENEAVFEKKERLREEINKKAKLAAKNKFAGNGGIDWDFFHREWITKMGGKKIELESIPQLEQRSKWLDRFV